MGRLVGIPREVAESERRVAATPDTVERLRKIGFDVLVENNAGVRAGFSNEAYAAAGASLVDKDTVWSKADVVLKVLRPNDDEIARSRKGQTVVSFFYPAQNVAALEKAREQGATFIAVDAIPRITRAQKMDALSSMANLAGYRAVLEAAHAFSRMFAGQITAAGKSPPAKILIIGAGVAGLAAIGAARGLGAVVRAFDTRAAVREQVQSMGAEFLEVTGVAESGEGQGGYAKEMSKAFIDAEMELFRSQARDVDVIITTALIPGKPAPKLILKDMVEMMRPGSVVVDMAAEQGGNCELTKPGERFESPNGVIILGYTDLPSRLAAQASQLYGTNLWHLLDDMTRPAVAGEARSFRVDFSDEVVRAATITKDGEITWPPPKREAPPPAPPPPVVDASRHYPLEPSAASAAKVPAAVVPPLPQTSMTRSAPPSKGHGQQQARSPATWPLLIAGALLLAVGAAAPPAFLGHLIVFVLACFIGYQVIWSVTPALHTPLMSVTNAISGIILVGGLLHASDGVERLPAATICGALAILIATINIAGGFLVTHRMLRMFRPGDRS